jgi:hypothetical protein
MIIIPRHNGDDRYLNADFFAIRDRWENSPEICSFKQWLEKRTAKFELHEKSDHQVVKIIFDTELDYLAFKLKYL